MQTDKKCRLESSGDALQLIGAIFILASIVRLGDGDYAYYFTSEFYRPLSMDVLLSFPCPYFFTASRKES